LGHFTDGGQSGRYLFVGVGSGITPLYSIYSHLLASDLFEASAFLYGERFETNLVPSIRETLEKTSEKSWSGLFLSQEEQLPGGWQRGYIHQ
jgi:ferredoxin-NADP reductase